MARNRLLPDEADIGTSDHQLFTRYFRQKSTIFAILAYSYSHPTEHFAHGDDPSMHSVYQNMSTTLGPMSSSVSLPPISAINFDHQHSTHAQSAPQDTTQNAIPPPARTLPPIPFYQPMQAMPQPEYVQTGRSMYGPQWGVQVGRMPLPSTADAASLIGYAPSRHGAKAKEVKRRTKTGCMTCRKRRIKVSLQMRFCLYCTAMLSDVFASESLGNEKYAISILRTKVWSIVAPRGLPWSSNLLAQRRNIEPRLSNPPKLSGWTCVDGARFGCALRLRLSLFGR